MTARGRGRSQGPITLPPLKLPEKGCHPFQCHSHQTRSCRSHPRRDADRAGWRGQANALSAVMARHADIEPAWARLSPAAQILCPAAFSSQVPGRKKRAGHEGRRHALKRKLSMSVERQNWNSCNESGQSHWAQLQRGISPSMTHTQRECHPRVRETYNTSCSFVRLFGSTPVSCREWQSLQAGRCERSWSGCLRRFNGGSWRQQRREFVTEENKSEIRWQAAVYIARHTYHFGRLRQAA